MTLETVSTDAGTPVPARKQLRGVDAGIGLVSWTVQGPVSGALGLTGSVVSRVGSLPLVNALVLHPPGVPRRLHPENMLARVSGRGRRERAALSHQIDEILDALVPRLADELLRRIDLDAIVKRVDLTGLAHEVIAELDLPAIIRESTTAVSSEAVREIRMRGISADDTVGRAVDRLLQRHRRAQVSETAQPAPPVPADATQRALRPDVGVQPSP